MSHTQRGFSLIEALVAMFVLSVGLSAAIALIAVSTAHSFEARDAIVGTQLAQEGTEIITNVRDFNFAAEATDNTVTAFRYFPAGTAYCDPDYAMTPASLGTGFCSSGSASDFLLSKDNGGFYRSKDSGTGTTATKFYRQLKLEPSGNIMKVSSFVWWGGANTFGATPAPDTSSASAKFCSLAKHCAFSTFILTDWK